MPKREPGLWWVQRKSDSTGEKTVVWYDADWDMVSPIEDEHDTRRSSEYEFIRPCRFEHDTNREQCIRDCLGE